MKVPAILVVDDEPDNFDVIQGLLPQRGYELYYAASGDAAIAALPKCHPDVILLDVMMPGMDGITVCQKIQAMPQWQMVPIIMVTALSDKEDIARCLQAGATDFVSKPVNGLELRARVHAMLRIKQQYDSIQALSKLQRNTIHLLEGSLQTLRGNLASSLSHELNTPLNGILGGLGLLSAHWEDMDGEEMAELLDLSHQSAQRMERLIQKFLVYLRLELATPSPQPPTVPLAHTIMTQVTEQCAVEARRSDDIEASIHTASLAIDSQDLQRLLIELVDNALKFSSPGTPVQVIGRRQEKCYRLSICDRGRGMTQSQVASIGAFMQFERSSYEQQGMGLGLKIAQKITELYGGHLLIDSTYKTGTTVHVDLPFARVEDALAASHSGETGG